MALGPNMPSFIKAIAAADIAFKILDDETPDQNQESLSEKASEEPEEKTSHGNVELRNLSFSYRSRQDRIALDHINVSFEKGTSTAIVGPSGAGKSTLIHLLERWYEPTTGSVILDGHDISGLDPKWLRSQIALVQQEPQLFNASIFDNIAYGLIGTEMENVSREEKIQLVHDACRQSRADEFISKLPDVSSIKPLLSCHFKKANNK